MKKKTKAIIVTFAAMLLVVATVFVTISFLTSQDSVVNTFTVGNVNIKLDEAEVDEYGVPAKGEDGQPTGLRTEEGNTYKILPGHTYTKDPTVYVKKGSEVCYVRVLVTLSNIANIDKVFFNANLTEIFKDYDSSKWAAADADRENDTRTYEFRYTAKVDARKATTDYVALEPLFTGFTVPGTITGEQLDILSGADMKIVAQAIQADGFETANEAWEAFELAASQTNA